MTVSDTDTDTVIVNASRATLSAALAEATATVEALGEMADLFGNGPLVASREARAAVERLRAILGAEPDEDAGAEALRAEARERARLGG